MTDALLLTAAVIALVAHVAAQKGMIVMGIETVSANGTGGTEIVSARGVGGAGAPTGGGAPVPSVDVMIGTRQGRRLLKTGKRMRENERETGRKLLPMIIKNSCYEFLVVVFTIFIYLCCSLVLFMLCP